MWAKHSLRCNLLIRRGNTFFCNSWFWILCKSLIPAGFFLKQLATLVTNLQSAIVCNILPKGLATIHNILNKEHAHLSANRKSSSHSYQPTRTLEFMLNHWRRYNLLSAAAVMKTFAETFLSQPIGKEQLYSQPIANNPVFTQSQWIETYCRDFFQAIET